MHASLRAYDLKGVTEVSAKRLNERFSTFHIENLRSSYVARQVPFADEVGQYGLI
jgi:hypothetical protein